jgi:hypothetical protein
MDPKAQFRQFISPFLQGPAADALIDSLAEEGAKGEQLSVAVNDQLTFSTASGTYLDKAFAQIGFTRPSDIGISDDAFRALGIAQNATKLVSTLVQNILEIFYGPESARAYTQSGKPEPYQLADGMTLDLVFEDGVRRTITFLDTDFSDISQATANEVADVITRRMRDVGFPNALALSFQDPITLQKFVRIFGTAQGPYSMVIVAGGEVQDVMEFPVIRDTDLGLNNTVWQVTKNYGTTLRFRWDGGPAPLLENIRVGDSVMVYGPQFVSLGLGGTFIVTAVRPPKASASFDAGWLEVQNMNNVGLLFSTPDIAPPSNSPGLTYSYNVTQALYSDLKFFLAKKNTPYSKARYSVGFEPAKNLLKVYLPATTKVVERSLVGASYIHMLYPSTDFDGVFGSATDPSLQVQVVNQYALRYPMKRLDNYGTGGTITIGLSVIPINYIVREDDFVTVMCAEPHGQVGYNEWLNSTNYATNDVVYRNGFNYLALQVSGPGFGGARDPVASSGYWQQQGPAYSLLNTTVSVSVETVQQDDPLNPYPGPYMADLTTTFTLTSNVVTSRQSIQAGDIPRTLSVLGTLPVQSGFLLFDLSQNTQEEPVSFVAIQEQGAPSAVQIATASQTGNSIVVTTETLHGVVPGDQVTISGTGTMDGTFSVASVPSNNVYVATNPTTQTQYAATGTSLLVSPGTITTIVLDPTYQFKFPHAVGADVTLLSAAQTYVPAVDGSDYPFYITSTAEARVYAQSVIDAVIASGINLEIVIVYPEDVGLGNAGNGPGPTLPESEEVYVWGT